MQKVSLGELRSIDLNAFERTDAVVAVERTLRLHDGSSDRDTVVVGGEIVAMIPVKDAPVEQAGESVAESVGDDAQIDALSDGDQG